MEPYIFLPFYIDILDTSGHIDIHSNEQCLCYVFSGQVMLEDGSFLHRADICSASASFFAKLSDNAKLAVIYIENTFLSSCNDYHLFYPHLDSRTDTRHNYMRLAYHIQTLCREYFAVPSPDAKTLIAPAKTLVFELLTAFSHTDSDRPTLQNHLEYLINYHYNDSLTLEALALESQKTAQYLSVYIKRQTGRTLTGALTAKRLAASEYYLRYTKFPITEIISLCGFSNFNVFNKAFKNHYGVSASLLRKKYSPDVCLPAFAAGHPGFFHAQKLYAQNYEEILPSSNTHDVYKKIQIDRFSGSAVVPVDILHLSLKNNILTATALDYLKYIQQSIPLKMIRVNGLLDIAANDFASNGYIFIHAEEILINLIQLNLRPIISFIIEPESGIVRKFLAFFQFILGAFGLSRIQNWQFEYNIANWLRVSNDNTEKNIHACAWMIKEITEAVKAASPDIKIGTSIFNSNFPTDANEALLRHLKAFNIIPDFFSFQLYASCLETPQTDFRNASDYHLSTNRFYIYQKIQTYEHLIKSIFKKKTWQVYAHICCTLLKSNIINETLFAGTFLLMNILKAGELVDHYILPIPDDSCHFTYQPNSHIFHGINSLLTDKGLPKPLFFAVKLLCRCGNLKIAASDSYLISMDTDYTITVLMLNYVHPTSFYCGHPKQLLPKDFYTIFPKQPQKKFELSLSPAKAESYLVEEWLLNKEHGSIFDLWLSSNNVSALSLNTIQHLKNNVHPSFRYYRLKADESLTLHEKLSAHEVKLLRLTPEFNSNSSASRE